MSRLEEHAKRSGIAWMVLSATAYSMFTIFGKNVLEELDAVDVLVWRFLLAVPLAWVVVVVRARFGGPGPFSVAWLPRFTAGVLFGGVAWLAFAGLDQLPGALYIVIIYTYPAMVAVGATLLGRPAGRQVWVAVLITLVGIALTVPEVLDGAGGATVVGLLFTLGNALTYAAYVIYSERLVTDGGDGLVASAWSLTGSLAFAVVAAAVSWPMHAPTSLGGYGSAVGLAAISTVLASMAFFLGVRRLGPSSAALVATTEPVLTLIWVVLILDETLKPVQLVGATLV
ncbi:MAG: EamA family transporter, partial [Actinobacteria bacterium]|nr:EamA family transporter [Actinomycetota bacterium]